MNALSRAVLIPLAPTQLPHTAINVPGPGPNESHSVQSGLLIKDSLDLPEPVAPEESHPSLVEDEEGAGSDQDEGNAKLNGKQDPYSNLDGAFGSYLADEPQPIAGRHNDVDDLLF